MQVGQSYEVPCIKYSVGGKRLWVPILGDRHADPELSNPRPHYHIDVRFCTDALLKLLFPKGYKSENVRVMSAPDGVWIPVRNMRLKCQRRFELVRSYTFPHCGSVNDVDYSDFEGWFEDVKVEEQDGCKRCPHKGMSLDGATEVSPGVVECPGHGLTWDMTTGKLVKRSLPSLDCIMAVPLAK